MIRESEILDLIARLPDGYVKTHVFWALPTTDAPAAFHLAAALAALSATCPQTLHIDFGTRICPNIFAMAVGNSGDDRKTSAVKKAATLLARALPEVLVGDPGSAQGLVDGFVHQQVQVIVYDEFGNFLKAAGTGTHMEPVKTEFNRLYDAPPTLSRTRANGKGIMAQEPRLSILAACATTYLEAYTDLVDWGGGFMNRWFLLAADRERLYPMPSQEDPQLRDWLVSNLQHRAGLHKVGRYAGFSPEGEALWLAWFHELHQRKLPLPPQMMGFRARMQTVALKIAMLLAWDYGGIADMETWQLTPEILGPAIEIAEMHLRSVCSISKGLAGTKDQRDRRAVLHVVGTAPGLATVGVVCKATGLLKRRVSEILETLLEEGSILPSFVSGKMGYVVPGSGARALAGSAEAGAVALPTVPEPEAPVLVELGTANR